MVACLWRRVLVISAPPSFIIDLPYPVLNSPPLLLQAPQLVIDLPPSLVIINSLLLVINAVVNSPSSLPMHTPLAGHRAAPFKARWCVVCVHLHHRGTHGMRHRPAKQQGRDVERAGLGVDPAHEHVEAAHRCRSDDTDQQANVDRQHGGAQKRYAKRNAQRAILPGGG